MSNFITTALSRQLVRNFFKNKRGKMLPKDETYAVFFDRATLERLLEDSTVTGIRFYFAAYEANPEIPTEKEYQNKMTLVAVSTKQGKMGNIDVLENAGARPAYDLRIPSVHCNADYGQLTPPPFPDDDKNGLITADVYQ